MTCLHHIFESQADGRPAAQALQSGEKVLSYRDLEESANRLARHLRAKGVARGDRVGLYLQRSEKPVMAILAILKAGAAYVPLDPVFPEERIRHILADAGVKTLVTERSLAKHAGLFTGASLIILDAPEEARDIGRQSAARMDAPESRAAPSDLCYIIYTSGTTGRPKGILTEHRNVVFFIRSFSGECRLEPSDRVYQGFSLGFDGSVEEIWLAFSAGATLVVGPPELARLGEETAHFMKEQDITVFSTVPTFLDMIKADVPSLRLIILSGEPCPPELVKTWHRTGRRMLNVYGPTETTVNATAWECEPGVPVTIGAGLPGYAIHILDEAMQPVPPGDPGELYIGGIGVARGYLNQPEMTRKHFLANPFDDAAPDARLYRTGDRVQRDGEGRLLFLGRIDGQVKVRGYRIELGEIEAVLREHADVAAAVVAVADRNAMKELAAYVVPAPGTDGGLPRDEILASLRKRLPAYMIPTYLEAIAELPRLSSGKVDRKALPAPCTRLVTSDRTLRPPRTDMERRIADAWEEIFQVFPISIDDDFFLDLGGDSLLAVEAAILHRSSLREDITARDIYRFPTIRRLAEYAVKPADAETKTRDAADDASSRKTTQEVFSEQPRSTRGITAVLQVFSLYFLYGLPMVFLVGVGELYFGMMGGHVSSTLAAVILSALFLGSYPLFLLLGILVKWTVIGRYKAGVYPVWGLYYFRWWLATRMQRMNGAGLLAGTPLINIYYRLMGARVGSGCVINTSLCAIHDLVRIGDGTCIGSETQLMGYRIENGMLKIGSISVGKGCYIGMQSTLGIDTELGDGAKLDDLSLVSDGDTVPPGEGRQGSPSQPQDVAVPDVPEQAAGQPRSFKSGILSVLAVYAVQLFMVTATLPSLVLIWTAYQVNAFWLWGLVLFASVPLFEACFWTLQIAVKACVLHRAKPGVYPVDSLYFLRKWYVDTLLKLSRLFTLPLYTTLYFPPLLRMLGAKIGSRAELSVIVQVSPDLVVMEEESFFADGSIIGGMRLHRGHFELAMNRVGRRTFLGNSALLPVGSDVGSGCLIGVLSSPPPGTGSVPDKTEWLGSPSFKLPHRKKVEGFSDEQTYKPTAGLYFARMWVDALRIMAPSAIEIVSLIGVLAFLIWGQEALSLPMRLLLAPLVGMAAAAFMALCVVAVKWTLIGAFKPVIKPLWCPYVWLNEVINGAHESVAAPALSPLLGTPFFAFYLRLMGCKVGRHVFLETTLFGEFDLVTIGDHAELNYDVVVQNHLFEDRIFKSSHIAIGNNCSVGNMSVILYDSKMGDGASIESLSLLMKGEYLSPGTRWEGVPTRRIML